MKKSTAQLSLVLEALHQKARALGYTHTEWAERAGIRNETLSRLRGRESCDFATLQSLAEAVGARMGVVECRNAQPAEDRFPKSLGRDYEERLLELCASGDFGLQRWRPMGPSFFMAGLAVMIASLDQCDRRAWLELAEGLHTGSSQVDVFASWLEGSPVRPSRFLPMLTARLRHAA